MISKRGTPLKPSTNHSGYQMINIMNNGKRVGLAVHTAVARAFCNGYAPNLQVNHKDGNKSNNAANNLEWVTPLENTHLIPKLSNKTLWCMEKDVANAYSYGDEKIDKPVWMKLLDDVRDEISRR